MPNQELLPGFESSVPTDRLFLAVFPESEHAIQLQALAGKYLTAHRLGSDAVKTERLHVTLFHLGDYAGLPPDLITRATDALARLTAQGFSIHFDQIGSFGNRQSKSPLVLTGSERNQPLHVLHDQLATHLRACGLGQHTRDSLVPHMTMAYDKSTMPFERTIPIAWPAREVVLVHSLLGKTQHIHVASKLLSGVDEPNEFS